MEIFIFIFWFAQLATTLYTTPPTWLSSSLVKSGDAYVISTLTDSSSTSAHTFTFSSAFSAVPFFGFGLKAYEGIFSIT